MDMIKEQCPTENGVLVFFDNGTVDMFPYKKDEYGLEYVDLFPNDEAQ